MTNMEIVNSAESIVNDPERIDYLSAGDISMLSAALGVARIILREQEEREHPRPLTLAELREMDGEPVWCVDGCGHERWVEWYPPKHMILTGEEMLYRCSSCDAKYSDVEGFRFCPNCGARMDLEV